MIRYLIVCLLFLMSAAAAQSRTWVMTWVALEVNKDSEAAVCEWTNVQHGKLQFDGNKTFAVDPDNGGRPLTAMLSYHNASTVMVTLPNQFRIRKRRPDGLFGYASEANMTVESITFDQDDKSGFYFSLGGEQLIKSQNDDRFTYDETNGTVTIDLSRSGEGYTSGPYNSTYGTNRVVKLYPVVTMEDGAAPEDGVYSIHYMLTCVQ